MKNLMIFALTCLTFTGLVTLLQILLLSQKLVPQNHKILATQQLPYQFVMTNTCGTIISQHKF